MNVIFGMPVVVSPDTMVPKMQLSQSCPVTPAFRAEMNAWMLHFFGAKPVNLIADDQVIEVSAPRLGGYLGVKQLHMNPRTFNKLQDAVAQSEVSND